MKENAVNEVDAVEVLRYARDVVLADESKWIKRTQRDGDSFCALGAVNEAAQILGTHPILALLPLYEECAHDTVASFNDHPLTSFSDVLDLFDRAIKTAEESA